MSEKKPDLFRLLNIPAPKLPRQPKPIQTQFSLGDEFFDELLYRIEEVAKTSPRRLKELRPPGWVSKDAQGEKFTDLSKSILSKLIETAFWASLEKEEGRSLRFSIVYRCSSQRHDLLSFLDDPDFVFTEPKPFDVRSIVKLAPAVGSESSLLVSAENDSLVLRGMLFYGSAPLKISVIDPGKLTISYYGKNVAFVSGSEIAFVRYSSFVINTGSLWADILGKAELEPLKDLRIDVLETTLRHMRNLGHGGTIIILPKKKKAYPAVESINYCASAPFGAGKFILSWEPSEENPGLEFLRGNELNTFARKLAKLTAVDGATLITKDLEILGFGAKLKGTKTPDWIIRLDPLDAADRSQNLKLTDIGNTRHQSAAKYVMSQPRSVAFVVSQDGNITSMQCLRDKDGKVTKGLILHSKLELVLF